MNYIQTDIMFCRWPLF